LSARGSAIQNVAFFLLVALTMLAFLGLIASFAIFWAAVLATFFSRSSGVMSRGWAGGVWPPWPRC
jgi:hypothetical protein